MTEYRITRKRMNWEASMNLPPNRLVPRIIMAPPTQSTIIIITVPSSSLTGWAVACRMLTRAILRRILSVMAWKRSRMVFSALKAFTMRSPPRVSSTWLMVSLQSACASREFRLSCLPISPITHTKAGANTMVNTIISGLIQMRKPKYSTMRMGSLMSMAMEAVMEFSTSDTSPLMRAMMSPLRSSVKKPMGRFRILS